MIKNIIFDFGDIFINLDKKAPLRMMNDFGVELPMHKMAAIDQGYEKGQLSNSEFLDSYADIFPNIEETQFTTAWNAMILDFPEYRLNFIQSLKQQERYRLFLLSNTNTLHIKKVIENMGMDRYVRFKSCFEAFYLSHEIQMRKPDTEIYEFVLQKHQLLPEDTLFIDDTKINTDAAASLGIHTWNLVPGVDDIIHLFQKDGNYDF